MTKVIPIRRTLKEVLMELAEQCGPKGFQDGIFALKRTDGSFVVCATNMNRQWFAHLVMEIQAMGLEALSKDQYPHGDPL